MNKIGLITIGQTPRNDIAVEMKKVLGANFQLLVKGALDGFTKEELRMNFRPDSHVLVTRLSNGEEIKITKEFLIPLIQKKISELERDVSLIVLLCAGVFPSFNSRVTMVFPSDLIKGAVKSALKKGRLGVIYPVRARAYMVNAQSYWGNENIEVYVDAASPRGSEKEFFELGTRLSEQNLDLILLNCMGINNKMKQLIRKKTGKPTIQPNTLIARFIKELT